LGAISHALTAIDCLNQRELQPLAVIVSQSPAEPMPVAATAKILERHHPDIPIAIIERDKKADAARASASVMQLLGLA